MIRLSIPVRQAVAKLTLPVLITVAFGVMLLGKADAVLAERVRVGMGDLLAPIYGMLAEPMARLRGGVDDLRGLFALREENARLRGEVARLRRWQAVAVALEAENQELKRNLHWIPDPTASYVTARVVADAGGVYARAVLLSLGPQHRVKRGEIALDDRGLVGRITEVGARSARVLLITDINSRFPVMLQKSGARAILVGTNGPYPHLLYWPEGVTPAEGERVVTSAEAGAFPAGLPVGLVHRTAANIVEVEPFARLDRLDIVRIFDYGLHGILPPETAHSAIEASRAMAPVRTVERLR
ncbi:MAG TPA: rod shape-determining protein MreC [Acetobacteraceae bacterium]|nr:rod shape-determining protein MreC [Acetobacteraceae bacterium]